ncbi:hypothetical protein KSP39_PZI009486 [Platanthera zijinensis]|uniref:Uncharacterized protein n=1 Tax=Platanthera zijinensis TaxID=2320716 RepID=A0AAP0G7E5_9ASPA
MDESGVVTVCDNGTALTEPPKKTTTFSVKVDLAGLHHPDASQRGYHGCRGCRPGPHRRGGLRRHGPGTHPC